MKISLLPDLAKWRLEAVAKVEQHFNALALKTLHADMAAIVAGMPKRVLEREKARLNLLGLIETARSPAEIEQVLSQL